ncbi:MAG: cytochrome c biogenesis heme-transporting ATPase CcmA [Pseudomonadota bacterium]
MLELRGVTCVRGGRPLFSGITASARTGELLRIRGGNGSGKTSLLRMVCGLSAPAQGQVLWGGEKVATLREEMGRQLVYIGHAAALKDDLSALENLQSAASLSGNPCSTAEALRALGDSGLRGRERLPARVLSQGQRRRAALARLALGNSTPLWVLDEPFNALDSVATTWLAGCIAGQLRRGGVVVLTSHQDTVLDGGASEVSVAL